MLKFRLLHAALAVHRSGSATRASAEGGATQPALTAAIASLERTVGVPLFHRSSRGMHATDAGALFCQRVEVAFAHIDGAEATLRRRRAHPDLPPNFRRLITERQLAALSALLTAGSFMAAARSLGVSQPNVHRLVRDLETVTGLSLWRQGAASGEATPDGRLLARAGDVCRREIGLAVDAARELEGRVDGALLIGALPLSRSGWVPDGIVATLARYPEAQVRVIDGPYAEQLRALLHGQVDIIVGALRSPAPVDDIVQVPAFQDPLAIAVRPGHPLLGPGGRPRPLRDLPADLTWVLAGKGAPGRETFERHLAAQGCPPPARVVECGSLVATRALLLGSDFVAPISPRQIKLELDLGILALLCEAQADTSRAIGLTLRKGFRPTRLYQALIDQLMAGPPPGPAIKL
ncbi:MAG: LysR family transcriptional regulator [Azospirillaceae bacterium]|nr:LysR family transcriptional regulator [Azospirillaceae bacterium]